MHREGAVVLVLSSILSETQEWETMCRKPSVNSVPTTALRTCTYGLNLPGFANLISAEDGFSFSVSFFNTVESRMSVEMGVLAAE